MVKLSVIVPIYNVEAYLAECLASIFAQDIEDMEVIAIIDGSPDNSIEIAREFAAQHPNMQIIEQENRGLSATRNRGIREAQGEYVCWIDSDDYYSPHALEEAYRLCTEHDLDFLAASFHQFPRAVEKCAPTDGSVSPVLNGREFMRYTTEHNYLIQWPSNYIHKRSFLLENELYFLEGCVFEGSPHTVKLATAAERCMYYNAPLTQYRIREDSLSHAKRTVKVAHDILRTLVAMVDTCEAADIPAEYMPYFTDLLCKRACFCATTYAELTETERTEYKAMCTARELMYFQTFVSPISYRNWLVKKHKKSAEDLDKKAKELSRTVSALKAERGQTRLFRTVSAEQDQPLGNADITYMDYLPAVKIADIAPINDMHRYWLGNLVSTEVLASRYKELLPVLYYHLVWRDDARTPLALSACDGKYGDNYDDLLTLLANGKAYTLLPSYFTDRKSISICRRDDAFLWNGAPIGIEELRDKIVHIGYDAVITEAITENLLSVPCLYDDIYLDMIALNHVGDELPAKVTDAFFVVKNARADEAQSGCDVYARINESAGKVLFALPGKTPCEISIPEWDSLCETLCEIVRYLAIYNGIQFRVVITPNGPKIIRMTADVHLSSSLPLSRALIELGQQVKERALHPTEEYTENNKVYNERKEYWENIGSKRHWQGFRSYMAMMFDRELEIDSQDPGITDEDRRWCYERGFFSYRVPEIDLNEDNYRNYVPDYEYFWVNRINSDYQEWISNKLSARFALDKFKDNLPEHYYNIRYYNGEKRIIALPDLPQGYTQSIDSIIELVKDKKQLAIKRTYGSHGDGFVKFTYDEDKMYLNGEETDRGALEQFLFGHEGLYLITEYVQMHPFIAAMYPNTLNTVRITCMNKVDERGTIGGCFFKIGHEKGGFTDNINTAAGGISIEVDKHTGVIRNPEFKRGNWYTPCPVHPDTGSVLEGTLPHWDMVIDGVKRIADELPQMEYMGFDIAITPDGFKVIEINVFPDYTKFLLKDEDTQAFLKYKVACKKKHEKIAPDRHSWLD